MLALPNLLTILRIVLVPVFALAFEHRVKGPDGERVLPFFSETFERLAHRRGFHSESLMTEVARRGSLRDVQLLAGHRSIQTTQRYIDGDSDAQRKLVSMI